MLKSVILGLNVLSGFLLLLAIVGLFKPWVVLWWEDTQNRRKALVYYVIPAAGFWGLGKLIEVFLF